MPTSADAGHSVPSVTRRNWARGIFIDLPYLIDSAWRRIDLRINQEYAFPVVGEPEQRPFWRALPFWLFSFAAVLVAFGPTPDGICTTLPYPYPILLAAAALAYPSWLVLKSFASLPRNVSDRIDRRFSIFDDQASITGRRRIAHFLFFVVALVPFGIAFFGVTEVYDAVFSDDPKACSDSTVAGASLERLVLCLLSIATFAAAWSLAKRTTALVVSQALAIGLLAAGIWWWLPTSDSTEASRGPYRHIFLVLVPLLFAILCIAALISKLRRKQLFPEAAVPSPFADWLGQHELFASRGGDVELTFQRVIHALLSGVVYRVFQLLLPPALVALVAPERYLFWTTAIMLALSIVLSTAGNMSSRWKFMSAYIERWLLTGTAFFVSMFVIAVALARVLGVSYVTTIIEAAPFGVLFSLVLIGYALSWLVEYWINRIAADDLLRMPGSDGSALAVPYRIAIPRDASIRVDRDGAWLMHHAIGRFLVMGKRPGQPDTDPAFHSHDMLELVRMLPPPDQAERGHDVVRHMETYFFAVNILLVLLVGGFAYAYFDHSHSNSAVPVATSYSIPISADRLKNLAERFLAPSSEHRPAIVIVASGGGTRAALYTAHLLQGLHNVGADRDIVLTSGVSGGGVALAYFTMHYEQLLRDSPRQGDKWKDFRHDIAQNFIGDVMEGATEWRILGKVPLTALLVESFDRKLFHGQRFSFAPSAPALILNTTVAAHPGEESVLLGQTLDDAPASDCTELTRPYRLLSGGRLIFTDIQQVSEFPGSQTDIADVRIPYRIVRDANVSLASAAALNANFPPVFPNARVVVQEQAGAGCARNYFVTDGGAEENLGLVSALLAVKSALAVISQRCRTPAKRNQADVQWCARSLRPIHFVLAEASAVDYDYDQDRGVGAALTAKERLTGGATNLLADDINTLYSALRGKADAKVEFHYLGMPLAFRARGGFGTHWMHADRIQLTDPRPRSLRSWPYRLIGLGDPKITLNREEVSTIWTSLHNPDPDTPYCSTSATGNVGRVHDWLCGSPPRTPRDMHMDEWKRLLDALRG